MKKKFFEFDDYSEDEIKEIWDDGLFTFDTSFLFNLYRYKKATSKEFIKILKNYLTEYGFLIKLDLNTIKID